MPTKPTTTAAPSNESWGPWPRFDDEMVAAAERVLRSGRVNYWTGDEGREFETEFARFCQTEFAIAVANGTNALELALYALGVGPGDEVIVPSRTFIASASCVVARGATPVVVDVDRESGNVTAATIAPRLTERTRAIIAVHLAGWPCDMAPILDLARARRLAVVEDCAQAHGATYFGRPVGSLGDVAAFSFCQDKIMTTAGEGGMVVTNRRDLWEKAWQYKDHGKNPASFQDKAAPGAGFRYLHEVFGSNYRLSEVQSAVGRVALRRLPAWLESRRIHAERLVCACSAQPALRTPRPTPESRHANYKFYTFVRPDRLAPGWSRDRIVEALRCEGIPCGVGSCCEVYREQAFASVSSPGQTLPVARELGETSVMLPVHPTLTASNMATMERTIGAVVQAATAREFLAASTQAAA